MIEKFAKNAFSPGNPFYGNFIQIPFVACSTHNDMETIVFTEY